jgi:hypothetical protein
MAALQTLSERVTLSPYEADTYESGGRRFDKIVRFATVDCVKAGWLEKNKGIWTTEVRHLFPETLHSPTQSANKFKHLRGFLD